ncbi:MAG: divergent PAP2 family protein [Candidatus Pacebacteria bacterium]|nr:divergent PAP2 family protein [Candidatus Paceibacterota bacterium]MDD4074104.1 divergent PAP2 family protein [Candidatus Paceibacterota bacterium]
MIEEILLNKILTSCILSWFIAQSIKAIILTYKQKKFRFDLYALPGNFPSSHSATVSALVTSVGLVSGFNSVSFAISMIFAFFIIYDAKVIRGAAGKQARSLNILIEKLNAGENIDRLKEILGHSVLEIISGLAIGIIISILIV